MFNNSCMKSTGFMSSSRVHVAIVAALMLSSFSVQLLAGNQRPRNRAVLNNYIAQAKPTLPEHVRSTLERIPKLSRRSLAMSYYFRRSNELENGWSWTKKQVAEFKLTEQYAQMLVEIEKVKREFAENNPGYTLAVNVQARSLGSQIKKWNSVSSVGRAAKDFMDSCSRLLADTLAFPTVPDSASLNKFTTFLSTYGPKKGRVPTVAVPGLSKHGQLRAFDFKVKKGRRLIAGTTTRTIQTKWEKPGWTDKLREAIFSVSDRFEGPLDVPYEPWHYNYLLDCLDPDCPDEPILLQERSTSQ